MGERTGLEMAFSSRFAIEYSTVTFEKFRKLPARTFFAYGFNSRRKTFMKGIFME